MSSETVHGMNRGAINGLSLAGLAATLVGNGIGRFAFIALMPALIDAQWFTLAQASQLGVATLLGYIVGSWASERMAQRWSPTTLIRWAMLFVSISFFASAVGDAPLAWYYAWRLVAGICGAWLMIYPPPLVITRHDVAIRGRVSSIVFSGVGLGPVLAGLAVPSLVVGVGIALIAGDTLVPLAFKGVTGAWLGLGTLCLGLTVASWNRWPQVERPASRLPGQVAGTVMTRAVWLILWAHALNAVGYLAHTMFWVDYLVREVGMTLAAGGLYWSVFGVGAALGPMVAGHLADRFGTRRCLLWGLGLKALAAALPLASDGPLANFLSASLMGLCTPGVLSLVSAYTLEVVEPSQSRVVWGKATFSFSLAQGIGGLLMAVAAGRLGSYLPLFAASAVALVGAVMCIALVRHQVPAGADGISQEAPAMVPNGSIVTAPRADNPSPGTP